MNNKDRAMRAFDALFVYNGGSLEDCEETVIQDFLTDLRHYCALEKFDFDQNSFVGLQQFERECAEEAENIFDIQVCEDCYFAFHNGVDPEFVTDKPDPLCLIGIDFDINDKCDVDSGAGYSEFSKTPCQGCGSALAGHRFTLEVAKNI